VFVIAKKLETSEAQVYRYLNGEKIPPEEEGKLKIDMQRKLQKIK
jgi:hypothetical protein